MTNFVDVQSFYMCTLFVWQWFCQQRNGGVRVCLVEQLIYRVRTQQFSARTVLVHQK